MTASGLVEFERLIMSHGMSYEHGYDSPHKLGSQRWATSITITGKP